MSNISIHFSETVGRIKPMHAVNNGPAKSPWGENSPLSNYKTYTDAGFPYARTHDSPFYHGYGGWHTVDVRMIFPDFNADPDDPASYDFDCTDDYLKRIQGTGTKVFYRLGASIEHEAKKYYTLLPADNHKYAVICEHIMRHYLNGWADGFHYDIEYWEIWNEPELDRDDAPNKRTWGGTTAQFYDFYEAVAKHIKAAHPQCKIGGPSLGGNYDWACAFVEEMARRQVPMDFFSWHSYTNDPKYVVWMAKRIHDLMERNGYPDAENINAEWNYGNYDLMERFRVIQNSKGCALTASVMLAAQDSYLDMLMYYDARPNTVFNGLFDLYTWRIKRNYHTMCLFNRLYRLGSQVEVTREDEDVYCVAAKDGDKAGVMLSWYLEKDEGVTDVKTVTISLAGMNAKQIRKYQIDAEHPREEIDGVLEAEDLAAADKITVVFKPNTVVYLELN